MPYPTAIALPLIRCLALMLAAVLLTAPAQAYRDAVDAWLRADLEHHARAAHADELARIRREAVHTSVDAGEVPTTIPWARVVEALYAMERAYEAVRVARGKVREAHAEYEAATRTRYG